MKRLHEKYPSLSKQTTSDFKKAYNTVKATTNHEVEVLPSKKRGRPALLPQDLMSKTIEIIESMRLRGAPVSANVINSIAKGVITANDQTILVENGGYLSLDCDWGRNVLYRMEKYNKKMSRRKATTARIPVAPGLIRI